MIKLTTKLGTVIETSQENLAQILKIIEQGDTQRVKIPVKVINTFQKKKTRKKKTYALWKPEEDTLIKQLLSEGMSYGQISKNAFLRERHSNMAIASRAYEAKLQLARKQSHND